MTVTFERFVRRKLAVSVLLLLPLIAACTQTGKNQESAQEVDPPPVSVEETMLEAAEGNVDAAAMNKEQLTVYLMDRNGYLAPMTLGVNTDGATPAQEAKDAIAWMTKNEKLKDQLPTGFSAILPAGLKVNDVKVDEAAAAMTIDFSDPLPGMIAADERHALEAIVWTMTELPGIDKVKLTVAGKALRSLPTSGKPVYDVLTRSIGINVEQAKGVDVSRSMAVTLYFSAQSAGGEGYLVPVTRIIDRTGDRGKAALEQLIKGPADAKALKPVLAPDMTIEQIGLLADTVNVNLKDAGLKKDAEVPAASMEALVLTLTEATGAPQVRVVMNGNDSFLDAKDRPYDQPVVRPTVVNALQS